MLALFNGFGVIEPLQESTDSRLKHHFELDDHSSDRINKEPLSKESMEKARITKHFKSGSWKISMPEKNWPMFCFTFRQACEFAYHWLKN
jgi:hypothetical protein